MIQKSLHSNAGTQRTLVVSSEEAIRDVLIHKQDQFSDRPPSFRAEVATQNRSIVFGNHCSPTWHYKKKHMMQAMKQHGDGLKHLESMTLAFGKEMLSEIERYGGDALDPSEIIYSCVGSVIMALTYGYSTHHDVKAFADIEKEGIKLMQPNGVYLLLDLFPWLRFVFPKIRAVYREVCMHANDILQTFRLFTNIRKEKMNHYESNVFIDHFLNLVESQDNSEALKNENIKLDEIDTILFGADLLIAGVSTTSALLYSLLGILVNYPLIQDKAYTEITEVIGRRHPSIEDLKNMIFIEAIILEAHRYIALYPVLIPHYCSSGSEFKGYLIPEGTIVLANIWSLHHNEGYWDEPWVFNPNRFIEDGKLVAPDHEKRQRVLSFGAGRRQCVGEVFAKNRLFILLTLLLQKFKFLPAEGHPKPQHDPREYDVRLSVRIKPYHLSAQLRK